jgi:hypothetical protein
MARMRSVLASQSRLIASGPSRVSRASASFLGKEVCRNYGRQAQGMSDRDTLDNWRFSYDLRMAAAIGVRQRKALR